MQYIYVAMCRKSLYLYINSTLPAHLKEKHHTLQVLKFKAWLFRLLFPPSYPTNAFWFESLQLKGTLRQTGLCKQTTR